MAFYLSSQPTSTFYHPRNFWKNFIKYAAAAILWTVRFYWGQLERFHFPIITSLNVFIRSGGIKSFLFFLQWTLAIRKRPLEFGGDRNSVTKAPKVSCQNHQRRWRFCAVSGLRDAFLSTFPFFGWYNRLFYQTISHIMVSLAKPLLHAIKRPSEISLVGNGILFCAFYAHLKQVSAFAWKFKSNTILSMNNHN